MAYKKNNSITLNRLQTIVYSFLNIEENCQENCTKQDHCNSNDILINGDILYKNIEHINNQTRNVL